MRGQSNVATVAGCAVAAGVGAAALLHAVPQAVSVIQVVGGAALIWMGQHNLRGGLRDRHDPPADLDEAVHRLGSVHAAYRRGLVTNLANPKIVVALTAMIARRALARLK